MRRIKMALHRQFASIAAAALLVLMGALMFLSAWDDTANSDDNVALISGYSYLRTQQFRLEPQNPPLIKSLGALPLLFMDLNEPWEMSGWAQEDPDIVGREFLYQSGNDADAIFHAARLPMILFALGFGAVLFFWTRKHYDDSVALLTLFFYSLSPTFIAHGRFVATDLGATAGFFVGLTAFLRFLQSPTRKNILWAGLALGFALLTKFSTIALLPIYLFLATVWAFIGAGRERQPLFELRRGAGDERIKALALRLPSASQWRGLGATLARTGGILGVALVVIYAIYLHHVWSYPPEMQRASAEYHRLIYGMGGTAKDIVIWASGHPLMQPWAEYFLGLLVALKASRWGQPLFFFGQVHETGLRVYFPAAYLLKEPLALHLLTLAALGFLFWRMQQRDRTRGALTRWLLTHFTEFAFLVMLAVYWTALIRSNMNIGVRHLLPAFPFMFILISRQVVKLYESLKSLTARRAALATLAILLTWQAITVLRVFPSYLAYFNELAGGPRGGWQYLNDSNLDWGQDVKRLAQYVEEQGIPGLHAEFFGPPDAVYYFREKYLGPVGCGKPPKGWVALSAMIYTGAPWNRHCDYRSTLPIKTAKARIGHSIFVFYVE
ncbi:MAG: hypothetical protein EXQ56_04645 [Acidobacteria bacterium]|nr:hypothetical protein [Acidobacteriota bacterium]